MSPTAGTAAGTAIGAAAGTAERARRATAGTAGRARPRRTRQGPPPGTTAVPVTVTAVADVSPHVRRVTLGGPDLARFARAGADQWLRLFLPVGDQDAPVLPASDTRWWPEVQAMPAATRPIVRNYTVRAVRTGTAGGTEIDLDVILHGGTGPASRWASRVRAGDRLGVLDQGRMFLPPPATGPCVLVGDETALPAIAGILASLPADAHVRAFVELPDAADAQPVRTGEHVHVNWLPRAAGTEPGALALDAVRAAVLPAGPETYAWLAGESDLVKRVRRHLVGERAIRKAHTTFTGYYRRGVPYYT